MFAVIKPKTLILALMAVSLFAAQFAFTGCADEESTALRMQVYMQPNQAQELCNDASVFRVGAFDMPMVGSPTKSIIWQAEFNASTFCNGGAITLDPVSTQKQTVLVMEALNKAGSPLASLTRDKETVLGRGITEPITWNADELVEAKIVLGKVANFSLVKASSIVKVPKALQSMTTTTLPDHRVLILGGVGIRNNAKIYYDDAYIYDPGTMTTITLPENAGYRANHTATLLSDGSVLIVGGEKRGTSADVPTGTNTEVYLFKPNSMTFQKLGDLAGRTSHIAVRTQKSTGEEVVLIAGGLSYDTGSPRVLNDAYVYNHSTGQIAPTLSPMNKARADFDGVALNDGRVVVQGGVGSYLDTGFAISQASLEIYDPNTDSWTLKEFSEQENKSELSRYGHKLLHIEATTDSGYHEQIGIVGGVTSYEALRTDYSKTIYMFDTNGDWISQDCQPSITGGGRKWFTLSEYSVDEKQVFMMAGGAYSEAVDTSRSLVLRSDGVIFSFKYDETAQNFCGFDRTRSYGYVAGAGTDAALSGLPLAVPRYLHAASNIGNGQILIVGGNIGSAITDTMEVFIEPTENNATVFTAY